MSWILTSSPVPTGALTEGSLLVYFACFVALRPKSTAKVIKERPVHLNTLFHGQA